MQVEDAISDLRGMMRMGNRWRRSVDGWQLRWMNSHIGRWYKRRMAKKSRQAAQAEIRGDRPRKAGSLLSYIKTKAW